MLKDEDREAMEEEEDEDDFLVPDGYLSNDEGEHSDSENGLGKKNDDPNQVKLLLNLVFLLCSFT